MRVLRCLAVSYDFMDYRADLQMSFLCYFRASLQ